MESGYTDEDGDSINLNGNTIQGNGGDDTITGGAGDDKIYGDGSAAYKGVVLITITKTIAKFNNKVFAYTVNRDGSISNYVRLVNNAHDAVGQTYTYSVTTGDVVGVGIQSPHGYFYSSGYGSNVGMNTDGLLHTKGLGQYSDGRVSIGFEDLRNLGDRDYDDVELTVDLGTSGATFANAHYNYSSSPSVDDGPGDDVIYGGQGNDLIYGMDGNDYLYGQLDNDTIYGGADNDQITGGDGSDDMYGQDGDDTFFVSSASEGDGDVIVGGNGPDDTADDDVLDLTGAGLVTITSSTDSSDDGALTGTVTFASGETLEFSQIETILTDPQAAGPVDGLDTGEDMDPGYTDLDGDQIDGSDGDDDTIYGNGGDDTIDSGVGDDTVDGGGGDDIFEINDEGDGIDNDVIVGGETDEDDGGDTLDASDIDDDLLLKLTDPEEGTLTDGDDTTEFEEIENFILGDGDDTVDGSDGGDNVDGGGGNDTMEGNDGDDTLYGGGGEDTIDGGDGDDVLDGGGENDTIFGGDGSDTVTDTSGNNVINTSGNSPLPDIGFEAYGPFREVPADDDPDDDRDSVLTGSGNDYITTGDDADTIVSGSGDDTIDSGIDDDVVEADGGADLVITGEGNDSVLGGSGNDTIYGGTGYPSDPINIPDAGPGAYGPDPEPGNGMDTLDGGADDDLIYGEDDADLIYGGDGDGADTLYGGIDNDTIYGGEGEDELIGGEGADSMVGGADRDEFLISSREDAFGDVIDGSTTGTDSDTLDLRGLGRMEVVNETDDADGDSTSGTVNFLDTAGNIEGSLTFSEIENLYICFTPGTRIATPRGEVAVQDLRAGDRVITRDDGVQEIHWIGKKKLLTQDLIKDPSLRPVLIKKGALGNDLPERDMMVSPNHRMLVANGTTHMLFDEREVLVAAKLLTGQPGIHQIDTLGTEYIHLLFERHEVILGDGAWTESFQPGDYSLAGMDSDQLDEITKLFPDLQRTEGRRAFGAARQSLKAHEARMLRDSMGAN